jgi:hypothetical protein
MTRSNGRFRKAERLRMGFLLRQVQPRGIHAGYRRQQIGNTARIETDAPAHISLDRGQRCKVRAGKLRQLMAAQ